MAIARGTTQPRTDVLYRTRYDPTQSEPVSATIYEALAAVEEVDVTNLDIQVYEYLDLEAVDSLMDAATPASDWQLEVTLDAYTLRLSADGELILTLSEV